MTAHLPNTIVPQAVHPKIELRNVVYDASRSESSSCFSAEVHLDGELKGTVSNDGQGGPTVIAPRALLESLAEEGASRFPLPLSDNFPDQDEKARVCTAEMVVEEQLALWLSERHLVQRLRTKTLFVADGTLHVWDVPVDTVDQGRLPNGALLLNAIPFAEALALYRQYMAPAGYLSRWANAQ